VQAPAVEAADTVFNASTSLASGASLEMVTVDVALGPATAGPAYACIQTPKAVSTDVPVRILKKVTIAFDSHASAIHSRADLRAAAQKVVADAEMQGMYQLTHMSTWEFCQAVILPQSSCEWISSIIFILIGFGVAGFKYWLALSSETSYAASSFDSSALSAAAAAQHQARLAVLVPHLALNFLVALGSAASREKFHWLLNAQSTNLEAFAPDIMFCPAISSDSQLNAYIAISKSFFPSYVVRSPATGSAPPLLLATVANGVPTGTTASTYYPLASNESLHMPIVFLEPQLNVQYAFGVDMSDRADWAATFQASMTSSFSASSARFPLTVGQPDFGELFTLPLFAKKDPACVGPSPAAYCSTQAAALLSGSPNMTIFTANTTMGLSSINANNSANWIGHLAAIVRWAPVLSYGLGSLPLIDVDVALYSIPPLLPANASMFEKSSADAGAANADPNNVFLALLSGSSTPGSRFGHALTVSDLAMQPASAASSFSPDRVSTQIITFGGRSRSLVLVARQGYFASRRTFTPLLILLLSLVATNLKDFAVAVVLLARFWWARAHRDDKI
jgi:hypothetical protein